MDYLVILFFLVPILFLLLALRPLFRARGQLRWVTCPECGEAARKTGRRGLSQVFECSRCELRIVRRWTSALKVVRETTPARSDERG